MITEPVAGLRDRVGVPAFVENVGAPDDQEHDRLLKLAVRLATLLKRPIGYLDETRRGLKPLESAVVGAMAQHPAFCRTINHAVADDIFFNRIDIDGHMLARLSTSPRSRLAVVITTSPMEEVDHVARLLAAAALSKRIRGMVLKADREIARAALGADTYDFATQEVPVLHPALCELDARPGDWTCFAPDSDADTRIRQVQEFGLQILGRFIDASEPVLSIPFSLRVPAVVAYEGRVQSVSALGALHCEQVVKLVRRRQQSWSAIIG